MPGGFFISLSNWSRSQESLGATVNTILKPNKNDVNTSFGRDFRAFSPQIKPGAKEQHRSKPGQFLLENAARAKQAELCTRVPKAARARQAATRPHPEADTASSKRGYGATVARLTPDQKVGSSNLSDVMTSRHDVMTSHDVLTSHVDVR